MDVSELVDKFIETNVPVSELLIEKHLPKTLLLPTLYEESLFDDCNLDDYLEDVKKDRVIVDVDRLLLLFKKCLEKNCAGEIIQTELKFKGCNINVLWKCQNKHKGLRTFLKRFKNSAILIVFGKRAWAKNKYSHEPYFIFTPILVLIKIVFLIMSKYNSKKAPV